MTKKLLIKASAFFALWLSTTAFALSTSVGSLTLPSGSTQSVKISNVSGTASYTNSAPGIVIVSKDGDKSYKVAGVTAGAATITFKDKKSTVIVTVIVTANSGSAVLTGRLLASNCFQCHGTNGSGGFEKLAKKNANELYKELKEFATGKEDANGIMAAHAMGFSDAQLNAIAIYFSSLP